MASRTPETLWLDKLSAITIYPGRSVGHRNCCIWAKNASPSIGPSKTIGAVTAFTRKPAMKVVIFRWPCGTLAMQRCPFGERPRVRVMLVDVPVSSRNTSFVASSAGWLSFHATRSACTSLRSCSLACRVFLKLKPNLFSWCHRAGALIVIPCSASRSHISRNVKSALSLIHSRNIGSTGARQDFRCPPIWKLCRIPSSRRVLTWYTHTRLTSKRLAISVGRSPCSIAFSTLSRKSCEYACIAYSFRKKTPYHIMNCLVLSQRCSSVGGCRRRDCRLPIRHRPRRHLRQGQRNIHS